jgi:hypothetical protein
MVRRVGDGMECPPNWDPGHFDGPVSSVVTVQGEAGLGFASNAKGPGRHGEESADPWYIGLDLGLWKALGPAQLLVDARYGRAFSIGRNHLNTGLWDVRGAVLFGSHLEESNRPWSRILDSQSAYTGMDGTLTTTYSYCPESTAFRKSLGYGAGVQIDRLTGSLGFTVNGVRIAQVARDHRTLMFELYGMYGPQMGLTSPKFGAGSTLRLIDDEGTVMGGALEGWSSGEGGALLITAFVGGGGVGGQ